jgi:lysophospholipase L1-like esterase
VLLLVTLALVLVAGELTLRVFFPIQYSMYLGYVDDGHVGWRFEPGRKYRLADGGTCTINNLGFRRPEDTEVPKPPGTVRIAVLGGSATFCYEVDDADTWTGVLERFLRDEYGDHIEVVNAGVPGYDAFVSKMNYLYRVRAIEPDIVIVSHTWNDVKKFHHVESGAFPDATIGPGLSKVRKFLRNYQLARRARALWWRITEGDRRENTWEGPNGGSPATIPDGGRAHSWARANYDDLALLLEADGVLPVFLSQAGLLSRGNLDDPDVVASVRNDYANLSVEETLKQWLAMTAIIEASAWEKGVLYIDVYGGVPHSAELFHDHVHLTRQGNQRVADVVFQGLIADSAIDAVLRGNSQ